MALIPMWKCDRDGKLFDDKKEAEKHDKLLELAANVSVWLENTIEDLSEQQIEDIGLLVANNKELLMQAMKGKPEILLDAGAVDAQNDDNVTAIAG